MLINKIFDLYKNILRKKHKQYTNIVTDKEKNEGLDELNNEINRETKKLMQLLLSYIKLDNAKNTQT